MSGDQAERARDWVHSAQAAVCDVVEPWEHGTVVRASRHPTYWDYNVVRVEDDVEISADEIVRVADEGAGRARAQAGRLRVRRAR